MSELFSIIAFIFLTTIGSVIVYFVRRNKKGIEDGSDFEILEE